MKEKRREYSVYFALAGAVLLTFSAGFLTAARKLSGFGEWYAVHVYPLWVNIWGRFFGLFPFSVVEIGLYVLICSLVILAVCLRKQPVLLISFCFFLASSLLFSYTVNCGVNYYRKPFSAGLNLETGKGGAEDLKELCVWLTGKANETREILESEEGLYEDVEKKGAAAMENLASTYPALDGFYPRPKPVMVSWILSVQQYSGVYSPFTVEANYNRDMTDYNIPHTICHELSHLRGFMREDEANFIGYLACLNAPFPDYNYSGYLSGWVYAGNALAKEDYEEYLRLYGLLNPGVREDLKANSLFWDRYEGQVAETASRVNDTYLKVNGQADGVKTYGRVVDLMLADFMEKRDDLSCIDGGKMVK